jgi:hypothetical protein
VASRCACDSCPASSATDASAHAGGRRQTEPPRIAGSLRVGRLAITPAWIFNASPYRSCARCGILRAGRWCSIPAGEGGHRAKVDHAFPNPSDRRLWRRRLLDGEGQLAAGRLRPVADGSAAAPRLLPAHRLGRRRSLRRALLPPLLAPVRGEPRVTVPPRPGHGRDRERPRGPPPGAGPDLRRRRKRREHARRMACPWP